MLKTSVNKVESAPLFKIALESKPSVAVLAELYRRVDKAQYVQREMEVEKYKRTGHNLNKIEPIGAIETRENRPEVIFAVEDFYKGIQKSLY